jgi:hypothetical protein
VPAAAAKAAPISHRLARRAAGAAAAGGIEKESEMDKKMPMPTTTFQWKSKDVEEKRLSSAFCRLLWLLFPRAMTLGGQACDARGNRKVCKQESGPRTQPEYSETLSCFFSFSESGH